jgi:hypothetical protein
MKFNFKVTKIKNYKIEKENFNIKRLMDSKIEVKELVLFTEGSQTKSQFECWTPMEMFLWWRTLRESSYPKREWTIMDAVFFLFINQISQIINTYVINFYLNFYSTIIEKYKYDIKIYKIKRYNGTDDINDPYLKSLFYLKKYLEELDKFYMSGGEYGLLLDVQLLYYEYYEFELYLTQLRHVDNDRGKVHLLKKENNKFSNLDFRSVFFSSKSNINSYELNNIGYTLKKNRNDNFKNAVTEYANIYQGEKYDLRKIFKETLKNTNFILIIFQSYFQNSSKFISLYSIPVIPILGIEYDTHGGGVYSSIHHVHHDLFHAIYLLYFLNKILYNPEFNKKLNEDIQEFFRRTVFLEELNKKALNKNNPEKSIYKDSQKLLWWILHEKNFNIEDGGGRINVYPNRYQGEINTPKPAAKNFFYIDKLKELLNILNNYIGSYEGSDKERIMKCISKLIEVCDFVLGQELRYNYRNKNNNEIEAVYGNNNNNFRESLTNPYLNSISRTKFAERALGTLTGSNKINNNFNNI